MPDEAQLRRHAFDPAGTTLLVVSSDNNFRLFHVGTGRLQVEFTARVDEAASTQTWTCYCWASALQQKQKGKSATARQLLIVGNSAGQLAAYDAALGQTVWQSAAFHEGAATGVCAAGPGHSSHFLHSVGADGSICTIDVLSGQLKHKFKAGKQPLTCVHAAQGTKRLLVGSSNLAVWDTDTEQRVYKYPGHTMPVSAVTFASEGQYAVSSSQGERHVAVWKASGKASKKAKPAAALLSMTEPPVQLDVTMSSSSSFDVLAVSASGRVYIWRCSFAESVTAMLRATVQVQQGAGAETSFTGQQDVVLTAAFQPGTAEEVLIARGSAAKPTVEQVQLAPFEGATQSILLQPQQAGGMLLKQSLQQKASGAAQPEAAPAAVGPDNGGEAVMLKPQLGADAAGKHSKKRQAEDISAAAELAQQSDPQERAIQLESRHSEGDTEPTLEQRVNALQIQHKAPPRDIAADEAGKLSTKAGSVVVLLSQALRSDDKQLLEKCFSMSNEKVVKSTVQQLAPQDAACLLQVAVQRLQFSPARGKQIAVWLRAVLLYHTAYLVNAPGVQGSLAGLYQSIEARVALYKPLVSLQGRLDLLLAQAPSVDPLASHLTAGPLICHDESDDFDEDAVEDIAALQADDDLPSDSEGTSASDDLEDDVSDEELID